MPLQPPALLDDDDWLAPPLEAALGEVFCRFDADADGAWSTAELQSFARTCNGGEEFGEAELSQVGEFTTDGHGRLTRRGFLEMMHLQTMARPEDTWADLRALGYDSSLSPKGVPGSSGAEAAPSEKPESVAAERDARLARTLQSEADAELAAKLAESLQAELIIEEQAAAAAAAAAKLAGGGGDGMGKKKKGKKKGGGGGGGGGVGGGVANLDGGSRDGRLEAPAHKQVPQLGKATAAAIAAALKTDGTLGALLRRCADDVLRAKALELVDPGQRERVDAQLVALSHDLGVGLSS